MAWVGYRVNDADQSVQPVAHAGFEQGYLEAAGITWNADSPRARDPSPWPSVAGSPRWCRTCRMTPRFAPWKSERWRVASAASCPAADHRRGDDRRSKYLRV